MTQVAGVQAARQGSGPFIVAAAVTAVCLLVSVAVALGWRRQLQGEGQAQFDLAANEAQQRVVQRLQSAVDLLQDTRAAMGPAPSAVTAESFERAVAAALPAELPSLATVTLVERVLPGDLARLTAARRAAGLPEFAIRSVEPGGPAPAVATFEGSTRGASILSGYDLRAVPALADVFGSAAGGTVRLSSRLEALPAAVVGVHPDLGRSSFALVTKAGPGVWLLALLAGDELATQAAGGDELAVGLAVGDARLGNSTTRGDGAVVDLSVVEDEARTTRPVAIGGGPLLVTVADVNGLAGGGWEEPGLLLGVGIALSLLFGALVYVLARGRTGALVVASEAERARDRSEGDFRAVVQHLSDLVVVTDAAMMVAFVTPSVTRLLGHDPADLAGEVLTELVHPDDRSSLAAIASRPGMSENGLVRFRHTDGSDHSFEVVVANRVDDPAIGGLVLTGHDVTGRVLREDLLAHEASHDGLTGLPNRTLVRDRLEHALVRAERTEGRVALVFGDLDGFKDVNDRHGHRVGDRLLVGVAHRLRGAARNVDTVARYAGDEFVVICEDLSDEFEARLAAERLHQEVARPMEIDELLIDVAMSLGVALAEPGESAESLLDRADQAMYRAKVDRRITFAA